jgi:deoxycytidylate deaminase
LFVCRFRKHIEGFNGIVIDGYDIIEAKPCKECIKLIQNIGIQKVFHTTNTIEIKVIKINQININDYSLSDSQIKFINDRRNSYKKK